MISFRVSRIGEEVPHGFDLGDLEIKIDGIIASSKDNLKFRMMIYLSLISIIDGLLSINNGGTFAFVATDSSFSFTLKHSKKNGILLTYRKHTTKIGSFLLLLESIKEGVDAFLHEGNGLPPSDPVYDDFWSSFQTLNSFLRSKG